MQSPDKITYFGATDSRNQRTPFGIKAQDRLKHVYVIGKTGMGKSTLLENMAVQDIQSGEGMAFIDPHGKTAELLLEYVPKERIEDVVYFAPFDIEHPISFNVMEDVGENKRHLVVNGLMSAFAKVFGEESFSDRMQYILQNTILALLEYPGATMLGINKMLVDKTYRNKVIANITDPSVKTYWTKEYAGYTERFAAEAIPAIQNKIGQFTSNPLIRNIIGQEKSSFDFRKLMDEGKIMIINLSKGRVGEANANLLGSMLITKIYLSAMSRADQNEIELDKLPNFYLYVDEFQSFANESFADILSEARKYKLNLTMAHQYIEQMSEEVRAAVFGNVGTMIVFRVGAYDAEVLEKEFAPTFTAEDLVNLGSFQIYLKLMIDGVSSQPFSAVSLPPIVKPEVSLHDEIVASSRRLYAKPKADVERWIQDWHDESDGAPKSAPKGPKPIDIRGGKPTTQPTGRQADNRQPTKREYRREDAPKERRPAIEYKPLLKPVKPVSLKKLEERGNNQRPPDPSKVSDLRAALKAVTGNKTQITEVQSPNKSQDTRKQETNDNQTSIPKQEPKEEPKLEARSKQQEATPATSGPSPDELKKILGDE